MRLCDENKTRGVPFSIRGSIRLGFALFASGNPRRVQILVTKEKGKRICLPEMKDKRFSPCYCGTYAKPSHLRCPTRSEEIWWGFNQSIFSLTTSFRIYRVDSPSLSCSSSGWSTSLRTVPENFRRRYKVDLCEQLLR
jgi:hypothetical protein